ncbi:MAG: phospholipase D-like domain-containing protein [Cyanobacteria bacterium P01_C01_bin.89]
MVIAARSLKTFAAACGLTVLTNCAVVPSGSNSTPLDTAWPDSAPPPVEIKAAVVQEQLPQDQYIQVYFNHNPAAEFTDPYRQIRRPGDDLEQVLVDSINQATRTVDVAVQEIRLPKVAQALVNRHKAGVQVRVIVENSYRRPWTSYSEADLAQMDARGRSRIQDYRRLGDRNRDGIISQEEADQTDTLYMLARAQVPVIDDRADGSKGSGLMHHKFVVIDGKQVVTGSANFTPSDTFGDMGRPVTRGNPNHLIAINSPQVARWFQAEFNQMWGDGPGGSTDSRFGKQKAFRPPYRITLGNTQLTVHFAPAPKAIAPADSTIGTITKTLQNIQSRADLALFVFSEQRLTNALLKSQRRGAQIRALIDAGFAFRPYSEGLDMAGISRPNDKCEIELGNQPWTTPIADFGFPSLPEGDLLHHKFAVLDSNIVITGSHNWSNAAARNNDETLVVIENSAIAQHFQREFDRLISTARLGIPKNVKSKINQQKQACRRR